MAEASETVAQQLEAEDLEGAERTAHSVRGVAGTLGAGELQVRAEALETAIKQRLPAAEVEVRRSAMSDELTRVVEAIRSLLGDADLAPEPRRELTSADLAALPAAVVTTMREALEAGDLEALEQQAGGVSDEHPGVAQVLIELCEAFDYEALTRGLGMGAEE